MVTIRGGVPLRGGEPAVLVARWWDPPESQDDARPVARRLAAQGWEAVYVAATDELVCDAARRAGLAVVVEGSDETPFAVAATVEEAWAAFFGGARVVAGPEEAVVGLRAYLGLAESPAAWSTAVGEGQWLVRTGAGELGAWTAGGGDLRLAIPPAEPPLTLCWVEPATGAVLAVVTPEADTGHTLRRSGTLALYLGSPDRIPGEAEWISLPEE
ncbi:MAG: hypothetical protein HYU66_18325 [Armatimonadetes bacterium]|nr:hypothetical protein [Armatimonadota bacterium]